MIVLPFPDKILWPNGRGHHMAKHRAFKKHKGWAQVATYAPLIRSELRKAMLFSEGPLRLRYTITPKTAHAIDRDNAVAAMKAYQDGIAAALGVDDGGFATPEIVFAEPEKPGRVEVTVG
jgi:crossover junction endodeoxyribonuclease RusA